MLNPTCRSAPVQVITNISNRSVLRELKLIPPELPAHRQITISPEVGPGHTPDRPEPGGVPAAMFLASHGKTVYLFEKMGKLGGTCLFAGCIPSKIFIEAAKARIGKFWGFISSDRMLPT